MNPFLLGMRLLWGGGRRGRARFLLMAFGCSLGVACLAAVLTIPAILAAHDARSAARHPSPVHEYLSGRPTSGTVYLTREDSYGSQRLNRVFVAAPASEAHRVPPGIDRLPAAGEVILSPRLHEILAREPGLAGLLPGRVTGTIGPDGLAGPDELYAYIGTTKAQIPDASQLHRFGSRWPADTVVEKSTLDILRFTLACVVLLPLAVFLSVCARLSAESRARRLAALRLVGLSVKDTLRVNAGETVAAAFLGALLGVGGYFVVNEIMARVGLPGLHWYPADGYPTALTLAICLIACPALAWFVGRHHAREAALTPLNVRRTAQRKPPKKFGTLLLVPGLGVISGYCVMSIMGRDPSGGSANTFLVPAAVLLTGAGLVFGLAPLTSWLARRLAGSVRSLPLALAMRRTEVEPGSSLRVVTGLVLLVYATSLTQGILVELSQVSRNTSPVQEYSLDVAELTPQQREKLSRVEGIHAHAIGAPSWVRRDDDVHDSSIFAAFGTCAQLAAFARSTQGCVDGKVLRLVDPNMLPDDEAQPGRTFPFLLGNGKKIPITVPRESVTVDNFPLTHIADADILIPPSLLPGSTVPETGHFVLTTDSDPQTVRTALDGIGSIAPTVAVEPVGINVDALSQLTVIRSLLASGMVLGLVIGVAAFVVSVVDRAMERRGQVTALALLGARRATLRAAQCVQVVLPLAVGLGAAVVTGWLAESSYLITGGGAVHWDWSGLPLLLVSCLGVMLAAAAASLPLVRRHVDPEHIRRD
ncbi:FtsX-like permease family protein [Streptomyces sp. QHH-9511]|uniref:FtsX-like permease family protein n=1 Tax=Streptomyces sp. QHH-9511 TaxID=2684468 RepID=UPI0013194B88|nr:FtsX-like permease family protein [Streptomyces sp. QHH-9511]QGZ50039.1 FtsX-like permease family protein [Streptomyces sp. QHH-9511]